MFIRKYNERKISLKIQISSKYLKYFAQQCVKFEEFFEMILASKYFVSFDGLVWSGV